MRSSWTQLNYFLNTDPEEEAANWFIWRVLRDTRDISARRWPWEHGGCGFLRGFFCVCWSVPKCFSEHWRGWCLSDMHAFGRKCDSDKALYKLQRVQQKGGGRGGESGWNHESKDTSLKMMSWGGGSWWGKTKNNEEWPCFKMYFVCIYWPLYE